MRAEEWAGWILILGIAIILGLMFAIGFVTGTLVAA